MEKKMCFLEKTEIYSILTQETKKTYAAKVL